MKKVLLLMKGVSGIIVLLLLFMFAVPVAAMLLSIVWQLFVMGWKVIPAFAAAMVPFSIVDNEQLRSTKRTGIAEQWVVLGIPIGDASVSSAMHKGSIDRAHKVSFVNREYFGLLSMHRCVVEGE